MKKTALSVLVGLLLVGMLAACRSEPESLPPGADIGPPSSSQSAGASDASAKSAVSGESVSPADSVASVASQPPEEHSVTGIIQDVMMGQVFVALESGQTVAFEYTTANIDEWTDTKPGAKVRVYYTGTLDGNDTGSITVTRIETIK